MRAAEAKMDEIIKTLRKSVRRLPDPSVTLVSKRFKDPFHVLISCALSLRTKDAVTLQASTRLFDAAKTPQAILRLSIGRIERLIYPVGFYKTKARNLKSICKDLIDRFHSNVPDNIDELLTLQGVGRKTANLVLTEGFGKLGICVDTHVHRISNRLGYVRTRNPAETEMALRRKLPKRFWIEYNTLLVTWGQNVCRPVSPFCSKCAISKLCPKIDVGIRR